MTHDTSRRWQMLAIAAVILYLLWLLAPVLMPFAFAAMLAYLGDPLADRLERLGLGRTLAVSIVFIVLLLLAVGALLLLIPLVSRQVDNLVQNLPRYVDWARNVALPWVQAKLHLDPSAFDTDRLVEQLKAHIGSIGDAASTVLGQISRSSLGVIAWLTNLVLIPVVAFYLLRDWDRLVAWIDRMLPRSIEPTVAYLAREADSVLGAFVRGQLAVTKPDISTAEKLKAALLAAKSISYADPAKGGASGVYFAKVLDRLGIADQMKSKTILVPGAQAGELVAKGEAEIGVAQASEIASVPGAQVVGPLPGDLNSAIVFAAGIGSTANDPAAAKSLIELLTGPTGAAVLKSKGMDPA